MAAFNNAVHVAAFKAACPPELLANMYPEVMPIYVYGNALLNMEWGPAMTNIFGGVPGLDTMFTSVLQQRDLSKVPSATTLLADPVLAPYAAHVRAQAAAHTPQRLAQIQGAYLASRKFIGLVSTMQR